MYLPADFYDRRESTETSELPVPILPKSEEEHGRGLTAGRVEPSRETPIVVRRSAIALGVEDREPKGICQRVSVDQGRVYCWVHVIDGEGRKNLVRWILNGKSLWETRLSVGSNNWRTWAYMTLRPGMIGQARAEILREDGELLHAESFEIAEQGSATTIDSLRHSPWKYTSQSIRLGRLQSFTDLIQDGVWRLVRGGIPFICICNRKFCGGIRVEDLSRECRKTLEPRFLDM
jgi:hypothetical protein